MGCILEWIFRKKSILPAQYRSVSQLDLYQSHIQSPSHQTINQSIPLKQQIQKLDEQERKTATWEKHLIKDTAPSVFNQEHQTEGPSIFDQEHQAEQVIKAHPQKQHFQVQQNLQRLLQQQSNLLKLIEKGTKVNKQEHFIKLKTIYLQQIDEIQKLKPEYSDQQLIELKAYIYSRLTDIAISQKCDEQATQFFKNAMEAYTKTSRIGSIQQRITLLNNYSVYKNSCGKVEEAKKYLKDAVDLMAQYFIVGDDRKYLGFINLACLEYESRNKDQGRKIMMKIYNQCKNKEIVSLARQNQKYYSQLIFTGS